MLMTVVSKEQLKEVSIAKYYSKSTTKKENGERKLITMSPQSLIASTVIKS